MVIIEDNLKNLGKKLEKGKKGKIIQS